MRQPRLILIVLDGWGHSLTQEGNAILNAKKPNFDHLWEHYPHTLLSASGEEVGLPWGELGGSEVGHLTIGSGRILYQNLPRITRAISDGSFYKNEPLIEAIQNAQKNNKSLHLVGLISSGGVHSHISHLEAIIKLIKKQHFHNRVFIHMITDGRDTPPKSAQMYLKKVKQIIYNSKMDIQFATVTGRYYAMDRDHHWERTLESYECMVEGKGGQANTPEEAINNAYENSQTDEFIKATKIKNSTRSKPSLLPFLKPAESENDGTIKDGDSIIFFNFRPDRMRQIVELFLFPRPDMPEKITRKKLTIVTMTNYNESMPVNVAFPLQHIKDTLAKIISDHQLTQLHIAETEKYAHVTYFFNGGSPEPNSQEKWKLIPSPQVPTFDKKPEMSADDITSYVLESNKNTPFDFILINFANADMVGHTGNYSATLKAIETIDNQLSILIKNFPESYIIITADHGNAEEMINPETGEISTGHSVNPVPLIIYHPSLQLNKSIKISEQPTAMIADLATTALSILDLPYSPEMTGINLLDSITPKKVKSLA